MRSIKKNKKFNDFMSRFFLPDGINHSMREALRVALPLAMAPIMGLYALVFLRKLQDAESHDEKINFDNFIKAHKEFIKKNCPDKLVSILRSI